MPVKILPKIDIETVIKGICLFLKKEFKKRDKNAAIVGVSGGVDSSLTAELCRKAGLEVKKVFMPYGMISGGIDITKAVDILAGQKTNKISKGNIMARVRMIILYDLAKKLNGLVVGTENLSEYYLGYFTLHGDQAADINPIAGLWKTEVIKLAGHLGLPVKTPTAGLWKGQTDEKELGFSYEEADPILYLYCVKKMKPKKIIEDFDFPADLVYKVVERVNSTEYKRKRVPIWKNLKKG